MSTTTSPPLYLVAGGIAISYLFLSVFILPLLSSQRRYLKEQSWTGVKKQWLSSFRAGLDSVFNTRTMMLDGYKNFSTKSKLFVLPQFSSDPMVILPADKVHEFLSKGDDRVDHQTMGMESIAMKYTIGTEFIDGSHFDVVRRQLTRKLPLLTNDVYNELILGMEDQWPVKDDGSWATVNVYPTCMKIVARAANRVFSGKTLCRNPEYLEASRLYSQNVFQTGMIMRLIPAALQPFVAPLITRGVRSNLAICKRLSIPIIEERMKLMREQGKDYKAPHDVLQWTLDESMAAPADQAHRRDPDWICRVLLILNMVAIHTTSMVTTNTLLDLYTSPDKDDFIAGLREEAERVLAEHGGEWTKDAVNSLIRVDSAIRETMRGTGLGDIGIPRIVKDPKGVDLSGGLHIPKGVRVAVPAHAIQNDEQFYPDAARWDAFRFSRPREAYMEKVAREAKGHSADHLEKVLDFKNRSLIATTDDFFTFGFGRHACPGRFFASQEMKLMIAHVVMNYDIEITGSRPENMLINAASVPKDDVQMRIRKRQL